MRPRRALLSACLATGTMVGFLICTPPALPLIQRDLSARFDELQWLPNAYALAQAALLVTAGSLGDRVGHLRVYLLGMGGYAAALALCAAAPSVLALVLLGALAGLVSAFALGNALSLVALAIPPARRGTALAVWGTSIAASYAAGPLLGGLVAERFGWRAVFLALAAIVVAGTLAARGAAAARPRQPRRPLDAPGVLLLSAGLGLVLAALIEGNRLGWTSAPIAGASAGGLLALGALAAWERRAPAPLLDPALLREPVLQAAALATLALSAGFFGMVSYLPRYSIGALGASPAQAAVQLLGVTGSALLAAFVAVRLRRRVAERRLVVGSLLALAAGAWLASRAVAARDYAALLPGLVVFGCGLGTISGPLAALAAEVGGQARSGVANAVVYLCRPVGAALGIAGFGALLQARAAGSLSAGARALTADEQLAIVHGVGRVLLVLGAVAALAALLSARLLRRTGAAAPRP